jgi:hypothetical protein
MCDREDRSVGLSRPLQEIQFKVDRKTQQTASNEGSKRKGIVSVYRFK